MCQKEQGDAPTEFPMKKRRTRRRMLLQSRKNRTTFPQRLVLKASPEAVTAQGAPFFFEKRGPQKQQFFLGRVNQKST